MTYLVGPSGCGKTTFISVLSALLTPDAGSLSVFGAEPNRMGGFALSRFRRTMVGFVFQQFNLLPALDAAENAAVPLIIQGMSAGKPGRRPANGSIASGLRAMSASCRRNSRAASSSAWQSRAR